MTISKTLIDLSLISGKKAEKTAFIFDELYQDVLEIKIDSNSFWG